MRDHKNSFSTQAEALRAAREAIWGTVPFSQRQFMPITHEDHYGIHVAADVNGDLVVFDFDNYGRTAGKPVVIKRGCL